MNRFSSQKDLTAQRNPGGGGMAPAFLCAACNKRKDSNGRRLERVFGLRTWVCAGCAKGKA